MTEILKQRKEKRLDVMCCCGKDIIGDAPAGLPYPVREWVEVPAEMSTDDLGEGLQAPSDTPLMTGWAYQAHGVDWTSVKGFRAVLERVYENHTLSREINLQGKKDSKKGNRSKGDRKKPVRRTWKEKKK